MKKILYVLLLLVELVLTYGIISSLWNSTFYLAVAMILIIWAALLVWVLLKLKKADDVKTRRKLYLKLALANASPLFVFIILVIWFIIAMSMAI
ncbi:MAG: hypothetical protein IKU20_01760 [Lachnospiraceae bacterium]|nr:hypothetical protein [Lachnospiraceae bacterium]